MVSVVRCYVRILEIFIYLYKFNEVLKGQGSGAELVDRIFVAMKIIERVKPFSRNRFYCFSPPRSEKKRAAGAHTRDAASML